MTRNNRNSPISFDLDKYWSYEDDTRLIMKGPTITIDWPCERRDKKQQPLHPSSLQPWQNLTTRFTKKPLESVPYLLPIARHHRQSMAISNDSTTPDNLSSRTILTNHHYPTKSNLLLSNLKFRAKETTMKINTHDNFFLTPVDKLHLQAELNGAIITKIKSSQSTTAATATIAALRQSVDIHRYYSYRPTTTAATSSDTITGNSTLTYSQNIYLYPPREPTNNNPTFTSMLPTMPQMKPNATATIKSLDE